MGFNSVLFICNDAMEAIKEDPAGWWEQAYQALTKAMARPVTFGFRGNANHYMAVVNQHADVHSLIAVGGNYANILLSSHMGNKGHHRVKEVVELLRELADKLGYKLVRKHKAKVCENCAYFGGDSHHCLRVPAKYERKQHLDTCRHWLENKNVP